MRMLRMNAVCVYALQDSRRVFRQRDARGRNGLPGCGHSGRFRSRVVRTPLCDVHNLNLDCLLRTRIDARRLKAVRETPVTHVALADNAALRIKLRNTVRTIPDAVL